VSGRRDLLAGACSLILAAIVLICLAEVMLRYGFGAGLGFYDELAGFLLVWLTFLGATMARRDRAHIGIREVLDIFSPRARRTLRIVEHAAMLALHLTLAWQGALLSARFLGERAITMPIPMGVFYLVLPVFAILTATFEARRLIEEAQESWKS